MKLTKHFREALKQHLDDAVPDLRTVHPNNFQPLSSNGLSHDHIRLGESGRLLRIPRGNQLGISASEYLTLQTMCFAIASRSGHAPHIYGSIVPNEYLPHGSLIVEEIKGRKAVKRSDAYAIAQAFAALHQIRPDESGLQKAERPYAGQLFLITEVFGSAPDRAKISQESKNLLQQEQCNVIAELNNFNVGQYPLTLIGGDSHPGNFLITADNKAYLVDVEFAMYDVPYIDLADASLVVTERLEPDVTTWSDNTRHKFFETWKKHAAPDLVEHFQSGQEIAERVVRLRTLLWLADWTSGAQNKIENQIGIRTKGNWDRMASTYLESRNLKDILSGKMPPYLPPFPGNTASKNTPQPIP